MIDGKSILDEMVQRRNEEILAITTKYGLSAEDLLHLMTAPALTPDNVQDYLNNCTKEQLAQHFYISGLVKLAETAEAAQKTHEQQPAPAQTSSSEAGSYEGQPS